MLILVHGIPLCLKTTLATDLSHNFQMGLVSTGFFGNANYIGTEEEFLQSRDARYKASAEIATTYLKNGWSIVVEGNYSKTKWRSPIIELACRYKVELVIIRCYCVELTELKKRALARRDDLFSLDKAAHDDCYVNELKSEEPITDAEVSKAGVLAQYEIDTCSWELKVLKEGGLKAKTITKTLESWIVSSKQ